MRLEPKFDDPVPTIGPIPPVAKRKRPLGARAPAVDLPQGFDIRNASPRHLAEVSMDFYVTGLLDWEEAIWQRFPPSRHTSPVFSTLPSISSAYAGTGLRRRSSIKAKIFWNKIFDTATSASWNVT